MAQQRDMWYLVLFLATSCTVNLTIAFATVGMAKTNYMPDFSLLGLPHGLKQGPVALGPGPGPLPHGEARAQAHLGHGDNVQGPLGHGVGVFRRGRDRLRRRFRSAALP